MTNNGEPIYHVYYVADGLQVARNLIRQLFNSDIASGCISSTVSTIYRAYSRQPRIVYLTSIFRSVEPQSDRGTTGPGDQSGPRSRHLMRCLQSGQPFHSCRRFPTSFSTACRCEQRP
jgi:hypothetical protein